MRAHPIIFGTLAAFLILILLFDWNWLRGPLERYISEKTQRTFTISHLDVDLGLSPTIKLTDLVFGNADWGKKKPMAAVKKLEFSVSLRDLFNGKVLVPRAALTDADLLFERLKDDRKNWILSDPSDTSPSRLRISTLSVNNGRLLYLDHGVPFELDVQASTFDPAVQDKVKNADARPENNRYSTRYVFKGKYHDASFSGNALTGEVLSFQKSDELFPIKGSLVAGTTKLDLEGSVADAVDISAIDVNLRISGETMANLYPFLLLPLPASPPYQLQGHLIQKGDKYTLEKLRGKIGSTDVFGLGTYLRREPRPLLTVDLHSKHLNLADLGPLIGIKTEPAQGKPRVTQAETNSRQDAAGAGRSRDAGRLLPAGNFEGSRLQAIDAEVKYESKDLKAPTNLPFESIRVSLVLKDAVLKLNPLEFGFAGGKIVSKATLDARQPIIKSQVDTEFQKLRLDKMVPENPRLAQAAGIVGGRIVLAGTGNSIADAAAKANGSAGIAMGQGSVSNLLDALSGLNGGKALALLIGGDKPIAVNCGGMAFDVKQGQGTSTVFIVDTEQTQIEGQGGFDLDNERFDLKIAPKPKRPGILSLRTPVRVYGTFRDPEFALEKGPITLRAGLALALAAVNPLTALLPLIETGPGKETDCAALLSSARASGGVTKAPVSQDQNIAPLKR